MLWTRDSDRPPLSAILPRLYLGAESDVTQDCLSSLGISYVLSVSRCSPQPSFLPRSRYLRIPIDDSLWDDLLPWIPEALSFIDRAMSSGASVLVHCAAGISRSPALAVAYIMYRLGLDLDQAYRFVKERRPSISPNFNFLGQLQLFQSTLSLNGPAGGAARHHQEDCNRGNSEQRTACSYAHNESQSDRSSAHHNQEAGHQMASETTERTVHRCQDGDDGHFNKTERQTTPPSKPSTLQLPASSASLQEKRRSLTLSLTPLRVDTPSAAGGALTSHSETKDMNLKEHGPAHREHGPAHRKEQGAGSPFSLGLNKLLGWGERLLLGGLFVAPVKMGQPALPYRC